MPNTNVNLTSEVEKRIQTVLDDLRNKGPALSNITGKIAYRPLRPSDFNKFQNVTPSSVGYSWSVAAGTSQLLSFVVPTGYAVSFFGLEGASNISSLLPGAYFTISINGNVRAEVNLADLANAESGKIYFFDQYVMVTQNTPVVFGIYNVLGSSPT